MKLANILPPGFPAERGKAIQLSLVGDRLSYTVDNKFVVFCLTSGKFDVYSVQSLELTSVLLVSESIAVAGDVEGSVVIYNIANGEAKGFKALGSEIVRFETFSGWLVAIGGDSKAQLAGVLASDVMKLRGDSLTVRSDLQKKAISSAAAEGRFLCLGDESGHLSFYDTALQLIAKTQVSKSFINTVTYNHDTGLLVFGTLVKEIGAVDAQTFELVKLARDDTDGGIYSVISWGDKVVTCSSLCHIKVRGAKDLAIQNSISLKEHLQPGDMTLGMERRGGQLVCYSLNGSVLTIDVGQGFSFSVTGKSTFHRGKLIALCESGGSLYTVDEKGLVLKSQGSLEEFYHFSKTVSYATIIGDLLIAFNYASLMALRLGGRKLIHEEKNFLQQVVAVAALDGYLYFIAANSVKVCSPGFETMQTHQLEQPVVACVVWNESLVMATKNSVLLFSEDQIQRTVPVAGSGASITTMSCDSSRASLYLGLSDGSLRQLDLNAFTVG